MASTLSAELKQVIAKNPVLPGREGDIDCVLAPFGCTGKVRDNAFRIILPSGKEIGTCADYVRHTNIVREKGAGSDAQQVFNFVLSNFRALNPSHKRGDSIANPRLDLRTSEAAQA